jgi:large subunit ribosomal protein L18
VAEFKNKQKRSLRRQQRVRNKVKLVNEKMLPRLSVFRSLNHIYGQIIDDNMHKTLLSSSSLILNGFSGDKSAIAHLVGVDLANKAKESGIEKVVFDRGLFRYHGRVKSFVEGLREGGLQV